MTGLRFIYRRASLSFFVVAFVPFVLTACKNRQERQQRPMATVVVQQARRATVPYVLESNGIVTPLQSAQVVAQVDGIIQSVDFQEGQEVRQGQPLFHVDPRPYQNAYNQALAILARDSANWRNAQANADRTKQLLSAKVLTQQEGDVAAAQAATTEATLRADEANLATAKFNLDNTVIRAPISGRTGALLVKQGNLVRSGGATPLVVINQVRPIAVRFSVPSSQLGLVLQYGSKGGLPVTAVPGGIAPPTPSIDSLAAEAMAQPADQNGASAGAPNGATSGSGGRSGRRGGGAPGASGSSTAGAPSSSARQQGGLGEERMMGKLSLIDNAVDTATGTVQLKATFDNANGRLWAGQFATTSLHLFDEQNALVVPQQAVVTGQRGTYVYVVESDTARQRAVIVERVADGLAILSSGIHEGDAVVTEGHLRLQPDSPVRLRGAADNAAPSNGAGRARRGGGRGGRRGGSGAGG